MAETEKRGFPGYLLVAFLVVLSAGCKERKRDASAASTSTYHSATPIVRADAGWGNAVTDDTGRTAQERLIRACISGNPGRVKKMIALGASLSQFDTLHRTPLMYAAKFGRKEIVEYLCARHVDLNAMRPDLIKYKVTINRAFMDIGAGTALMECALNGDTGIARILLKNGADASLRSAVGNTALFYAAREGHPAMVDLLLEKTPDPDSANGDGETALSFAVRGNQGAVVDRMLNHNPKPSPRSIAVALCAAADSNYAPLAERLLKAGKYRDTIYRLEPHREFTPLVCAATQGRIGIARMLLSAGADSKWLVGNNRTALSVAAGRGDTGMVRLLLDHGAKPNPSNYGWPNPFREGLESGNADVARIFFEHGYSAANLRYLLEKGAVWFYQPEIFAALLPILSDSLKVDFHKDSTLAELYGYLNSKGSTLSRNILLNVATLMRAGVEIDFKNLSVTPLMVHAAEGDIEAMKRDIGEDDPRNMLSEVNVNMEAGNHETALYFANLSGNPEAVQLLLENGAEVNPAPDYSSQPLPVPLAQAMVLGNARIIEILIDKGARVTRGTRPDRSQSDNSNNNFGSALETGSPRSMPLLLRIALDGHTDLFRKLEIKQDPLLTYGNYRTAFLAAATQGNLVVAEYLLKQQQEQMKTLFQEIPEADGGIGAASFVMAAQNGHTSILKLLVGVSPPPVDWSPILSRALARAERTGVRSSAAFILQRAFGVEDSLGASM